MTIAYAFALLVAATFSLWLAASVRFGHDVEARGAPGVGTFTWLLVFVAVWSILGAVHTLVQTLAAKVLITKFQYIGICAVPALWFLFAFECAGATWVTNRRLRVLLWTVPVATVLLAFTDGWHGAVWTSVRLTTEGFAVYQHGWWFWITASYSYGLALVGTIALLRTSRQSPPPFRGQFIALVCAAVVPWLGNLLYLTGATRPGLDLTPLGFSLSCVLLGSAIYRNHLFDLVPVARDLVVDSLDDAVIVIDPARRVLDMNAAARQLATRHRDWMGQPVTAVFPMLGDTPCEATTRHTSTQRVSPLGDSKYYDVQTIPLRMRRGHSGGCVVVLRDTTAQHAATAERDALQARVQEQQRRESLSVLAGGLAHDFNNLLTGIVGNADLLSLEIAASSELGASVSAIQLGAQRAADLVAKMLAYAGERHGSPADVDLDALVREILDLLRASAARHCRIEYTGQSATIHADPTQIRQVAMNLLINAAESVEEGSGTVSVTTGTEHLGSAQLQAMKFGEDAATGEYGFIEVRDNGSGMSTETLQRIFHPFFTTKPQGHGLGLSAVQGIVLGHRGALRVDSSPGCGSRFRVWFPLASDTDAGTAGTTRTETGFVQA